jgi:hypothetical protein
VCDVKKRMYCVRSVYAQEQTHQHQLYVLLLLLVSLGFCQQPRVRLGFTWIDGTTTQTNSRSLWRMRRIRYAQTTTHCLKAVCTTRQKKYNAADLVGAAPVQVP